MITERAGTTQRMTDGLRQQFSGDGIKTLANTVADLTKIPLNTDWGKNAERKMAAGGN